jgi:anti-sigma regulatory factor (Ser/Thr protein kinase)
MGLSGVRRLVDAFKLKSGKDGTVVTVTKWLYRNNPYAGGTRS